MTTTAYEPGSDRLVAQPLESEVSLRNASGVSWAAILAGAAGAASLSLILLVLGTGLGLSSVSPWAQSGIAATTFGISTILWITFTQIAASGMGGYLAGRLRVKWVGVHTDETYFRDTAHGFLAWSVATLVTAAMLTSAIGSIVGSGVQAGAAVAGGAATTAAAAGTGAAAAAAGQASQSDSSPSYLVDSLFRKNVAAADPAAPASAPVAADATAAPAASNPQSPPNSTAEVARIFANSLTAGAPLPAEDVKYVAQLVAQRTGIPQQEAEKRVTDTYTKAQAKLAEAKAKATEAADTARKASAYGALWLFVSLLVGAFVASFAATFGGRHRDL
ncbi:hypothetical protein [Acidovorax sp. Root219]|uniref:hypothetical protein n=1 Tax=Acidovorax sp. Root219 TaxID=1736493 RepID=UPI00070F442D|nr:hypothetical protein [Acidovorax sp. Root219]KRC25587.1 hypothetical protein ASE28_24430 [Acidovorax sp. Root219]